jgi:hypothetical protein
LNSALFGGVRRLLSNPVGAIGEVALVEVFEKPTIV